MNRNNVTIYDVAAKAGVSAATVSRVVNNRPGVNKQTKARVKQVLEECHYVPDVTARSLVYQSSKMIGILISDIRTTHHTDAVYYIERMLAPMGYCCLIFNTGTDEQEQVHNIEILGQRKVEAAILIGSIYQNEAVKTAISNYLPHVPVILLNGYINLSNVYGIVADEMEGISNCVQLMANKGRNHVVYVYDHDTPSGQSKCQGFKKGVGLYYEGQTPLMVKTDGTHDGAYATLKKLMLEHPETDGIVFADDRLALIGLRCLTDMKITVPRQVAVIGVNNSQYAKTCIPTLTSLDNMIYDLSLIAVRNMQSLMQGERVSRRMMIYSEVVEREST